MSVTRLFFHACSTSRYSLSPVIGLMKICIFASVSDSEAEEERDLVAATISEISLDDMLAEISVCREVV
jgi:hypothetical protein